MVECEICGGDHDEKTHGEPLVVIDMHIRNIVDSTVKIIEEIKALLSIYGHNEKAALVHNVLIEYRDECSRAEQLDWFNEFIIEAEESLIDAGFIAYNNSDQGAYLIFGDYEDDN